MKHERELAEAQRFLKVYNAASGSCCQVVGRLDSDSTSPQPDFRCGDDVGRTLLIEVTRLPNPRDEQFDAGADKFLRQVIGKVEGSLLGTYWLFVHGDRIQFNQQDRDRKVQELSDKVVGLAPSITTGETTEFRVQFPCRLFKECDEGSELHFAGPTWIASVDPKSEKELLEKTLREAYKKFQGRERERTILLLGVFIWAGTWHWERVFGDIDMGAYSNVDEICVYSSGEPPFPVWAR